MQKDPDGDAALTAAREARVRSQRIERLEVVISQLRLAQRARIDDGLDAVLIENAIDQSESELALLQSSTSGLIIGRKRPKKESDETCHVFIDECGTFVLPSIDKFAAFALVAIIVRDRDLSSFEKLWRQWKVQYLGNDAIVHEPDIRNENKSFWCAGDDKRRALAVRALSPIIEQLPFSAIACVLHRPEFMARYGLGPLDSSLPKHPYAMMLHFLLERAAISLQEHFDGAKAHVIIEARGGKEDALMQYEFARLFLDGTTYLSSAYFRAQFFPGIVFRVKGENCSGLQLADLLARPCAEKVLQPKSDPDRWANFRDKLCTGAFTLNSILGLKIIPWDDRYEDVLKS